VPPRVNNATLTGAVLSSEGARTLLDPEASRFAGFRS
jgi:hypothetical protein